MLAIIARPRVTLWKNSTPDCGGERVQANTAPKIKGDNIFYFFIYLFLIQAPKQGEIIFKKIFKGDNSYWLILGLTLGYLPGNRSTLLPIYYC